MGNHAGRAERVRHALEPLERRTLFTASTAAVTLATVPGASGQVAIDAAGDVFGTTAADGTTAGTVFEVAAGTHAVTTLATFGPVGSANTLGVDPTHIVIDAAGNLFGSSGPSSAAGLFSPGSADTLWELPAGTSTVKALEVFGYTGIVLESATPVTALSIDGHDDLFYAYPYQDVTGPTVDVAEYSVGTGQETSLANGSSTYHYPHDAPLGVFATDPAGDGFLADSLVVPDAEVDLYRDPGDGSATVDLGSIGSGSLVAMTADAAGDLFATTTDGRLVTVPAGGTGVTTAATPDATTGTGFTGPLVADAAGDVYAVTTTGGADGYGALVERPAGGSAFTVLSPLDQPQATTAITGLTPDASGDLYGTTTTGTTATVFEYAGVAGLQRAAPAATDVALAVASSNVPTALVTGRPVRGVLRLSLTAGAAVTRAQPTVVDVYATPADGARTLIGTTTRRLRAGSTVRQSVRVRSAGLAAGTYTLTAETADGATLTTVASAVTVSAPAAVLQATVGAVTAAAGRSVVIPVTVTNTGNVAAAGPLAISVYMGNSSRTVHRGGLRPGQTVVVRVRLPAMTIGTHSVEVSVNRAAVGLSTAVGSVTIG